MDLEKEWTSRFLDEFFGILPLSGSRTASGNDLGNEQLSLLNWGLQRFYPAQVPSLRVSSLPSWVLPGFDLNEFRSI
jgi:hypothetical protein